MGSKLLLLSNYFEYPDTFLALNMYLNSQTYHPVISNQRNLWNYSSQSSPIVKLSTFLTHILINPQLNFLVYLGLSEDLGEMISLDYSKNLLLIHI